jgi:hypothetical protein
MWWVDRIAVTASNDVSGNGRCSPRPSTKRKRGCPRCPRFRAGPSGSSTVMEPAVGANRAVKAPVRPPTSSHRRCRAGSTHARTSSASAVRPNVRSRSHRLGEGGEVDDVGSSRMGRFDTASPGRPPYFCPRKEGGDTAARSTARSSTFGGRGSPE